MTIISHPPPVGPAAGSPARSGWTPARLAYVFYTTAAAGAVIGQSWVALEHLPFPADTPGLVKVAAVLPFALCLELLAMVLAAMGDARQRHGEAAYGFRVFSAVVATLAVGIIVVGHWSEPYLVAGFGTLSVSAYVLWLLHSAARRRDALRAAGKLDEVAPAYGLWRRLRHPIATARAAELARVGTTDPDTGRWRPLGLHESLRAAEEDRRAAARRPAIAAAIDRVVRAEHADPLMAEIASATLDLDRIAAQLAEQADYAGWAQRLAPAVTAQPTHGGDELPAVDESVLYVPDEWVSHLPPGGESPAPSDPDQPPGEGESPTRRPVSRPGKRQRATRPGSVEAVQVTDSLLAQAKTVSGDSDTRMAWLWHTTGGRASGRQLAVVGGVSAATGIRRASQWRLTPPPDPRGGEAPPVPVG